MQVQKPKNKGGRPKLSHLEDWQDKIIQALQNGVGMKEFCSTPDPDGLKKPPRQTVIRWYESHPEFRALCERAREWAADVSAEKHHQVINDCYAGVIPPDVARVVLNGLQWRAMVHSPRYAANSKSREERQYLDANGNPTNPPSAAPLSAGVIDKLDAIADAEY